MLYKGVVRKAVEFMEIPSNFQREHFVVTYQMKGRSQLQQLRQHKVAFVIAHSIYHDIHSDYGRGGAGGSNS